MTHIFIIAKLSLKFEKTKVIYPNESPERVLADQHSPIADEIRSAASEARTEEDLKMRVEPILRRTFKDIAIDVAIVEYEKTTALRANMDAVYGYLIIEYKAPGKLATALGARETKRQLQRYLEEEAIKHQPVLTEPVMGSENKPKKFVQGKLNF